MSFYNMIFGMNSQTPLLLATVGLREHEIDRFRDVSVSGNQINVYSRTGGGNREDYPNTAMRKLDGWVNSYDDDYDSTYCTDEIKIPEQYLQDVENLSNIFEHGIRPEFAKHLAKALQREPTEADKTHEAYLHESRAIKSLNGELANGHTFVPFSDNAMRRVLEFAEKNNGELRSCWGILPLCIECKADYCGARMSMRPIWKIDLKYWEHCKEKWATDFPVSMAKIQEYVSIYVSRGDAQ